AWDVSQTGDDSSSNYSLQLTGTLSYHLENTLAEVADRVTVTQDVTLAFSLEVSGDNTSANFDLQEYSLTADGSDDTQRQVTFNALQTNASPSESGSASLSWDKNGNDTTGDFTETMTESGSVQGQGSGTDGTGSFQKSVSVSVSDSLEEEGNYQSGDFTLTET